MEVESITLSEISQSERQIPMLQSYVDFKQQNKGKKKDKPKTRLSEKNLT